MTDFNTSSIDIADAKIDSLDALVSNKRLLSLRIKDNKGMLKSVAPLIKNTNLLKLEIDGQIDIEKSEEACPTIEDIYTSPGIIKFCKNYRGLN